MYHPIPERQDQARGLCDRQKIAWRDDSALRVTPAQQRFICRDCPGLEIGHWLIIQIHLAAVQCFAQIHFDLSPLAGRPVEARVEKCQIVATFLLRRVQRQVRPSHEFFGVAVPIERSRNSHAG
tara:strand:- start:28 stop:399 length:372 start_codon:yes stop_codon:yes gene_type:complete